MGKRLKYRLIACAIILVLWLFIFGPGLFEPTESPRFVGVQVVSDQIGAKGARYFTLVNTNTSESWEVKAASGPFSTDYRGPAILELKRGRWTGKDHFNLYSADLVRRHSN